MLTERQAWLKIAKACDVAGSDGSFVVVKKMGRSWGLCTAVGDLWFSGEIEEETARSMFSKIHKHAPPRGDFDYAWETSKAGAKARAAFCRKMAALCKPAKRAKAKAR